MIRMIGISIIGCLGGLISGLFGVGGGILFVPLLTLLLNIPLHAAIGTSLVAIIPTAFAGAFRHFSVGTVDFKMAVILAIFGALGAWLGATLSLRLDVIILRKILAGFLFLVALRLFFQ